MKHRYFSILLISIGFLILNRKSFSPDNWNQRVNETQATAIEGAVSLTNGWII